MFRDTEVLRVVHDLVDLTKNPEQHGFDQILLILRDIFEIERLNTSETQRVFQVVENLAVRAAFDPLR